MEKQINHKYTNNLIRESSPYLLQHAHNPVNWFAWGDEAFEKAKAENKLVLVSIGYAACHWCHVMEHQSFENEAIAEIMNRHFVCIKVDREERPDVDQVYMSAVQLLTGSGGWPLNCFTLPDGRPVYGGTYFTPDQWVQVLEGLTLTYNEDKARVLGAATEITQGLQNHELLSVKQPENTFTKSQTDKMFDAWKPHFDLVWGGNKRAPKFPMPISYEFLLQYATYANSDDAMKHLNLTLTKMAQGGIYDQLAGGFARYSVDEKWLAPHFEKMLYDNGQLVSLYSNAYKKTRNPEYKRIVEQTLEFIKTEMTTKEGAFYSAFDADSEGVEGKFYVWQKAEIEEILGNDAAWFCDYYNVTLHGNWEETNILWITEPAKVLAKYNFTQEQFVLLRNEACKKLLDVRTKRVYPALDDKVLTSWNALMAMGYLSAYEAFQNPDYLKTAQRNVQFLLNTTRHKNGGLYRNYKNEKVTINAFLDDYSLAIQLFTKLYQNTFDESWLDEAKALTEFVIAHFHDEASGMFFYTSDLDPALVARKMELSDNVIPSSNSIMANNLFDLGTLFSIEKWKEIAKQMLSNVIDDVEKNASYYGNWGILLNKFTYPIFEVVFMGKDALNLRAEFVKEYHLNCIIAGTTKNNDYLPLLENRWVENETLIYVCRDKACRLPVNAVSEAIELIK